MNDVMLACLNIMRLCCGPSGLPPGGSTRRRLAGELFEKLLISKSLTEYGPWQGHIPSCLVLNWYLYSDRQTRRDC